MTETVSEGRVKIFDRERLPDANEFAEYRKTATTMAVKIPGKMRVVTREGIIEADNGWLAIDANGWPYPIADDVFQTSYERVTDTDYPETPPEIVELLNNPDGELPEVKDTPAE